MSQSIAILGRQPALGLAELESLYGAAALQPLNGAALLDVAPADVAFERLGGSLKLAKHLTTLNTTDWPALVKYVADTLPQHLGYIPVGKIRFGLSVYGLPFKAATINRAGLELKKIIKNNGRSVRIVPNTAPELSTAQTLHNQLTGPTGLEIIFVRQGQKTILGQVTHVQNINAYAARDQARPARDPKVGMLPPKLAQMIINLAQPGEGETVLDPFCGTGVVLQEALLMGRYIYGTDIDPRMIDYSRQNLQWLVGPAEQQLAVADATNYQWDKFDTIVCETYLGRPFSAEPSANVLQEVMQDVDTIHRKFLKNVGRQTSGGFRLCIAVPAWKTRSGFKHLKMLDSLEDLGYTRLRFVHAPNDQLIYHRPGQIVARELVVLIRK